MPRRLYLVFACLVLLIAQISLAQELDAQLEWEGANTGMKHPSAWTVKDFHPTYNLAENANDLTSGQQPRGVLMNVTVMSVAPADGDTLTEILNEYVSVKDFGKDAQAVDLDGTIYPTAIGGFDFVGTWHAYALVDLLNGSYMVLDAFTPRRGADDPLFTDIVKSVQPIDPSLVETGDEGDAEVSDDMEESVEVRQWASSATGTSQYGENGWGFIQALGEPNVDSCSDNSSAWASAGSDTSEILAVEFESAVIPSQVNIHQTYTPGAIVKVELSNTETSEIIEIPNSADDPLNTECPRIFTLDIYGIDSEVNGVIIYLDQSTTGNWNEIDAVELVGTADDGTTETDDDTETGMTEFIWEPDGMIIMHPADWVNAGESLGVHSYIATSEDALELMYDEVEMPEGEFGMQVILPHEIAEVMELDPTEESPESILTQFAELVGFDAPEAYNELEGDAVITFVGEDLVDGGAIVVAVEYDFGTSMFIMYGDFDEFEDTAIAIMNSLEYFPID